jgi:hypothetical protein
LVIRAQIGGFIGHNGWRLGECLCCRHANQGTNGTRACNSRLDVQPHALCVGHLARRFDQGQRPHDRCRRELFPDSRSHPVSQGTSSTAALGEARYDRFALLTDIIYMKLGLGASITRTRGTDEIGGAVGVSAGLTVEMVIAEAAAAYEVARGNGLTSPRSSTALDLYAGGRAWWQRADAQINALGTLNIFDLTFSRFGVLSAEKSVSCFDP